MPKRYLLKQLTVFNVAQFVKPRHFFMISRFIKCVKVVSLIELRVGLYFHEIYTLYTIYTLMELKTFRLPNTSV